MWPRTTATWNTCGCSPIAAKYVVRMLTGDLRIGLRDGLFESALTEAFGAPHGEVHRAMILEGDAGTVALLAKRGELAQARLRLFHAIPPMLADAAKSASNIVERSAELSAQPLVVEDKYDGVRAQLHVAGDRVAIYGRDLGEVTVAFPEIVAAAQAAGLHGIFDGEIIGWSEEGQLPATSVILRLSGASASLTQQERAAATFVAFDCLARGESSLMHEPYRVRRAALESSGIGAPEIGTLRVAEVRSATSGDEIESLFIAARMRGENAQMFERTASRLEEMQSQDWLGLEHLI